MLNEGADAPQDARHLLVMLDQCDALIIKIRKNTAAQSTMVALTYLLVALAQSIDRLRTLLFLVDVSSKLPGAPTVVLLAAANHAIALALAWAIATLWQQSIGAVNLLVSFSLALCVALHVRKIRFKYGIGLLRALGRRFIAAPIDFFIGPKDVSSGAPV